MSIRTKLLLVSSIIILVMISSAIILVTEFRVIDANTASIGELTKKNQDYRLLLRYAKEAQLNVQLVRDGFTDISATRGLNGLDDGPEIAAEEAQKFKKNITGLRTLAQSLGLDTVETDAAKISEQFDSYYAMGREMAASYVKDGTAAGNVSMPAFDAKTDEISQTMGHALALIDQSLASNDRESTQNLELIRLTSMELHKQLLALLGLCVLIDILGGFYIFRLVVGNLSRLQKDLDASFNSATRHTMAMDRQRNDEFGAVARTIVKFRDSLDRMDHLSEEQERQKQRAAKEKREALHAMGQAFETQIKHMVDAVASAAVEMDATSGSVAQEATQNCMKLSHLLEDLTSANSNVQMVSSAARELSSSINEIGQQVARAATITHNAVKESEEADRSVQGLAESATHIEEVVGLINSIASQINLLALNATIEAARAGEAGKGFAVVASEVKNLATQTTRATDKITAYIASIQSTTDQTVHAIQNIGGTIREINHISAAIAAAIEEQSVATQEISRNTEQAADKTQTVNHNAQSVSQSVSTTGSASTQMRAASAELARQAEHLRAELQSFIGGIKSLA